MYFIKLLSFSKHEWFFKHTSGENILAFSLLDQLSA
jgi:hypothetical protein